LTRAFHLQPGGMHLGGTTDIVHLGGTTDIVLPLPFSAEQTSLTAVLARQRLIFMVLRAGHDFVASCPSNQAGRPSAPTTLFDVLIDHDSIPRSLASSRLTSAAAPPGPAIDLHSALHQET
jgi:hypothetical protein